MDRFIKDVSDFAIDFDLSWATEDVARVAAERLVDTIGCGIGGWDSVLDDAARSITVTMPETANAGLLLCENRSVPADHAAFINTVAMRYLDFNDAYPGGHPSDMIGGLVAVAGANGASGSDLLAATIVAYEVNTRVSTSVHLLDRAIDQGFGVGLGTVAGAGRLLGLTSAQIGNALGMMTVAGVPLRASRGGELTNWKGAATAVFVRNAVYFCLLAKEGVTGPPSPIHGRHGLSELLHRDIDIPAMPRSGGEFRIGGTRLKYWPVAYNMQPALWAASRLRSRVDLDKAVRIRLLTDKFAHHESGSEPEKWNPQTRETADHSLPYVIAWMLLDGQLDSTAFDDESIGRPDVRRVLSIVEVEIDPEIESQWPDLIQARLEVTDADGTVTSEYVVNPPGHDLNPLGPEELEGKFVRLAAPKLGEHVARELARRWLAVREEHSVADLMRQGALYSNELA